MTYVTRPDYTTLASDTSSIDLIVLSSMSMYHHYSSLDSLGYYCIALMTLLFVSEVSSLSSLARSPHTHAHRTAPRRSSTCCALPQLDPSLWQVRRLVGLLKDSILSRCCGWDADTRCDGWWSYRRQLVVVDVESHQESFACTLHLECSQSFLHRWWLVYLGAIDCNGYGLHEQLGVLLSNHY